MDQKPTYAELEQRIAALEKEAEKRKQAESALQESQDKYRNILESIAEGYFEVDLAGNFTFFNSALCRIMEYEAHELMGMNNRHYMTPETAQKVYRVFNQVYRTGKPAEILDYEIITKNNSKKLQELSAYPMVAASGNPIGFRGVCRDVTERKKAEDHLLNLQKMEAIATLASGIAHDFNNILYPIIGFSEISMDSLPADSETHKNLEHILYAAKRGADLVRQILDFSSQNDYEQKPLRIQPIVKETLKFLKASLPTTIKLIQQIDQTCGPIIGSPTQIHQVIMNLCTNAFHAMEEKGGLMTIELAEHKSNSPAPHALSEKAADRYLRLSISDTGLGMSSAVLANIFEPYFTTKPKGKGTGLGLSVVHGIVKDHNGRIQVQSEPGQGTTFHIYLPIIADQTIQQEAPRSELPPMGNEHILLVDDEKLIVEMEKTILTQLGYRVTSRTSSIEALKVFQADPDRFDLVMTDSTMSNMTGTALAQKILELKPHIPILILTGFAGKLSPAEVQQMGIRGLIMKPVVKNELAKAVRKALENPGGAD